jgi:hypothetical protein
MPLCVFSRIALVLGAWMPFAASAATVVETYTARAAFEARLGIVRVVDFDDVDETDSGPTPFAADRYAATLGIVITGEGGQYASRDFGFPDDFVAVSAPNMYAPGPVDNTAQGANETTVTFSAGASPALVAGFGAAFVDPDDPGSGFTVRDPLGATLGSVFVPAADGSTLFRGIVTVDDLTNEPVAAIARVDVVSGTAWPENLAADGVPLDDFVFAMPVPVEPSTTTTMVTATSSTTTTVVTSPTSTTTTLPCPPTPRTGCRQSLVPGASKLVIRNLPADGRDFLKWTWAAGAATTRGDMGDPTNVTPYDVCLYSGETLLLSPSLRAGGRCGRKRCWTVVRSGFRYQNPGLSPNGILSLRLHAGPDENARITLVGRRGRLGLPPLPLALPLTVQLVRGDGALCWEARYSVASKNTSRQLRADAD